MAVRNQELFCHNCEKYVRFQLDEEVEGQHIIKCPECGHEHYRYVNNGIISDTRWGSANRQTIPTYYATSISVSSTSWQTNPYSQTASSWTISIYGTSTT